jgi:chemotaxis protein methyltransferase CheR
VIRNLYHSLVDGGWLIVSPAEASNALFSPFSAVQFPGVVVYRKIAGAAPRVVVMENPSPVVFPVADAVNPPSPNFGAEPVAQDSRYPGLRDEAPQDVPQASEDNKTPVHETDNGHALAGVARDCANEGRLAEAIGWCEKAIAADRLNPAHYYLFGTIQQEQGQAEAAQRSLTRALYLDPDFVLAHFALGNAELSRGRPREARRHFTNTLAMLQKHPRGELLPESEGLTAERLAEIVESVLSSLPRAAATRA